MELVSKHNPFFLFYFLAVFHKLLKCVLKELVVCLFLIVGVLGEESYEFKWDEDDIINGENFKIKISFSFIIHLI